MKSSNRERIKEINEQQLQERLKVLTNSKELDRNPIDDIIEGPNSLTDNNTQQATSGNTLGTDATTKPKRTEVSKIDVEEDDNRETVEENTWKAMPQFVEDEVEVESPENLSSLQNRFGVRKIKRPIKDAQLTARIESVTLKRFKEIVKAMYYPDKPNINETVTQIIRAFVDEYDKNNSGNA